MNPVAALGKLGIGLWPLARGLQVQQHVLLATLVLQVEVNRHDAHLRQRPAVNIMGLRGVQVLQCRLAASPVPLGHQLAVPLHRILGLAVRQQNIQRALRLLQHHREGLLLLLQHRRLQKFVLEPFKPASHLLAVDARARFEVVEVHLQLIGEDIALQGLLDRHLLAPVEIDLVGPIQ